MTGNAGVVREGKTSQVRECLAVSARLIARIMLVVGLGAVLCGSFGMAQHLPWMGTRAFMGSAMMAFGSSLVLALVSAGLVQRGAHPAPKGFLRSREIFGVFFLFSWAAWGYLANGAGVAPSPLQQQSACVKQVLRQGDPRREIQEGNLAAAQRHCASEAQAQGATVYRQQRIRQQQTSLRPGA